jgi:hypothetical protein
MTLPNLHVGTAIVAIFLVFFMRELLLANQPGCPHC